MTEKRFTTNGYYIYDHFKEDKWLVNEVEAQEIVDIMNNLDTKARENSKALSTLQKKYNALHEEKEYWKGVACNNSNFVNILLHELDIAQKQGYEVSDPFKKLMEKKEIME